MRSDAGLEPKPHELSEEERATLLRRVEAWLEIPMLLLALVWLVLLVLELTGRLPAALHHVVTGIWAVFIAEFVVRVTLADDRPRYVRRNLLVLVALVLPAFRMLRVVSALRLFRMTGAARGVRAARLVTTFNRTRRGIHRALARRHALGYVVAVTLATALLGSAGMFAFEPADRYDGYGHALWWTAMLLATMGTENWPVTSEGRLLSLVIAVYGFAIFGYIAGTLASWFVGKDRADQR
jgi:voltage-gated potassium channel